MSLRFRDREELRHLDARASVDAVCIADNDTAFDALSVDDYAILRFREQLVAYYISKPTMRYVQAHSPHSEYIYNEFHNRVRIHHDAAQSSQDVAISLLLQPEQAAGPSYARVKS